MKTKITKVFLFFIFTVLFVLLLSTFASAATYTDEETGITWTYTVNSNGTTCTITGCSLPNTGEIITEITIPYEIDVYTVTGITGEDYDANFFGGKHNDAVTSVFLPNTINSIGDYTFYSCPSLETVSLPEGLTSIGNRAFLKCENL